MIGRRLEVGRVWVNVEYKAQGNGASIEATDTVADMTLTDAGSIGFCPFAQRWRE